MNSELAKAIGMASLLSGYVLGGLALGYGCYYLVGYFKVIFLLVGGMSGLGLGTWRIIRSVNLNGDEKK